MARRVLIVEDDSDLRALFRHALVLSGFDVTEAGDGLTALRQIDINPPDVVVLDLGLPVVSGDVVRNEIASQPHTRNISVVVVTGRPGDHSDLLVDTACVLRKPVTAERLVAEVMTVAARKPSVQY